MIGGIILIIVIIFFFAVFIFAQNSKKDTTIERYGEAVSNVAQMAANEVSIFARNVTEPTSKKKARIAKEELSKKISLLLNINVFWTEGTLERLLSVDERFANHLSVLGLSEQRWREIAYDVFCIGVIKKKSRDSLHPSNKSTKEMREHIFYNERYLSIDINQQVLKVLKDSLSHFGIPEYEWIEYGDAVLEMHNIIENLNLEELLEN